MLLFPSKMLSVIIQIGVSKNRGTPKWMVKIMENPIKMDDLGGKPTIFGNTQIHLESICGFFTWFPWPICLRFLCNSSMSSMLTRAGRWAIPPNYHGAAIRNWRNHYFCPLPSQPSIYIYDIYIYIYTYIICYPCIFQNVSWIHES